MGHRVLTASLPLVHMAGDSRTRRYIPGTTQYLDCRGAELRGRLRSGTLGVACMTLLRAGFSRVARPNAPSSLIRRRSRPAPLCAGPAPPPYQTTPNSLGVRSSIWRIPRSDRLAWVPQDPHRVPAEVPSPSQDSSIYLTCSCAEYGVLWGAGTARFKELG